ncbi:TPA: hypothetical protein ACX6QX_003633 [Photobacterium damselae]
MGNKAAFFSIFSLGLRVLTGPISIFFITTELSPLEQSVYYTFLSIAAIQWVFELGISTSIVQKMASLKSRTNINALIQLGFIFFSTISVVLFFVLYIYANWVLSDSNVMWGPAWILYSSFICLNIINNLLLIIEEGRLNPERVYFVKLVSSVSYSIILILSLKYGLGLIALGISQVSIFIVVFLFLGRNYLLIVDSLKTVSLIRSYLIFKSIIKFQSKLSIVWVTGYLFWNFYTIFFFKFVNEIFSGQFSATNAIFNALAIGMASWLSTKRSIIGRLNSEFEYDKTLNIFYKSSVLASIGYLSLSGIFLILCRWVPNEYLERLLPYNFIIEIMFLRFLILIQELILIYLRTFNDEPLYKVTIINYVLTPVVIILTYHFRVGYDVFLYSICFQGIFTIIYILMASKYIKRKRFLNAI